MSKSADTLTRGEASLRRQASTIDSGMSRVPRECVDTLLSGMECYKVWHQ